MMDFEAIAQDLCSSDAMTFENAFHLILPEVEKYKDDLVKKMIDQKEGRIRARFIELLGHCKDESLISIFKEELKSSDVDVINWTLFALESASSKEGTLLAKSYRQDNPEFSK